MKKFMKLEKNKLFLSLSFFLIIALLILVRENNYPLIWENKILVFLFRPKHTEKIFSSISISYVAAYLFYLLQIYIPNTLKNKNALNFLGKSIIKELEVLKYLLFIIMQTTKVENDSCTIKKISNKTIYIMVEKHFSHTKYLRRYTFCHGDKSTCNKILKLANNTMEKIYNNYFFHDLDPYIASRLFKIDLKEFFDIFEHINKAYSDELQYTIKNSNIINDVKVLIDEMEKLDSAFNTVQYHLCDDAFYCKKYDQQWSSYQDEFMLTVNM